MWAQRLGYQITQAPSTGHNVTLLKELYLNEKTSSNPFLDKAEIERRQSFEKL
jgi:hypothetical protein